MLEVI